MRYLEQSDSKKCKLQVFTTGLPTVDLPYPTKMYSSICYEDTCIFGHLYFPSQSASQVCKAVKQTFVDPLEQPSFDFENPQHNWLK